jgi:hypothetical protein
MATQRTRDREDGDAEAVSTLRCRNHDGDRPYTLSVRFLDADGEVAFTERVRLESMGTATATPDLDRGLYRVVASTGDDRDAADCLVGPAAGRGALVEVGNGLVSVTDGSV